MNVALVFYNLICTKNKYITRCARVVRSTRALRNARVAPSTRDYCVCTAPCSLISHEARFYIPTEINFFNIFTSFLDGQKMAKECIFLYSLSHDIKNCTPLLCISEKYTEPFVHSATLPTNVGKIYNFIVGVM